MSWKWVFYSLVMCLGETVSNQAKKTEHSGAKKGRGAYWGRKKNAKHESNKVRREEGKTLADQRPGEISLEK